MSAPKIDHIYFHCMDLTVTVVLKKIKLEGGGGMGYSALYYKFLWLS